MSSYSSLVLHGDATEGTVRNRKIQCCFSINVLCGYVGPMCQQ